MYVCIEFTYMYDRVCACVCDVFFVLRVCGQML